MTVLDLDLQAVLDDRLPVGVFADMVQDCGLERVADYIRRLEVRLVNGGIVDPGPMGYTVGLMIYKGTQPNWIPLYTKGGQEWKLFFKQSQAEEELRKIAVNQLLPFVEQATQ